MSIQDNLDKVIQSFHLLVGCAFLLFITAFQINRLITGDTGEWTILGISVGAVGTLALIGAIDRSDTESKGNVFYLSTIGMVISAFLSDANVSRPIGEVAHSLIAPLLLLFIAFGAFYVGESFGDWYLPDRDPEERVLESESEDE